MFAKRSPRSRMIFEYVGLICAAPFIYLMGAADQLWLCCVALAIFGLFRGIYDSNLFAAPFEVIPARLRSSALGIILSFGFLTGAFSPLVLSRLSKSFGLDGAIASLSIVHLTAGLIVVVATYTTFSRDFQRNQQLEEAS